MPAGGTLRLMMVVTGGWLAGATPMWGQSPDCSVWEEKHPAHTPNPRFGHAMAYDGGRQETLMIGNGSDGGITWTWDGHDWTEHNAGGPGAGSGTAMAYDELRQVVVLFDGQTWEWDGVQWTLRSYSGPPWRGQHAMVYDSARGVTVLFGGRVGGFFYGDTWEWDGNAWTLRNSGGPSPRGGHAMAYDASRGVTVLFGGYADSGLVYIRYKDTWEWDGTGWVLRSERGGPGYRRNHAMAYAAASAVTVLFGGIGDTGNLGDTWKWDGTTWTLLSKTGPPRRLYAGMAYDRMRAVTVLFGGFDGSQLGDTWELPSCPRDSDGDGVPDPDDECDISDLRLTVVIDGCDSGVANHLFDDGCTMADRIAECIEEAGNHGTFVSCVVELTNIWMQDEIITSRDKGPIQRCAAQADLPQSNDERVRPIKGPLTLPIKALSRP